MRFGAIAVSAVYAAALYFSGIHLQSALKQLLAYAPSALALLALAFDLWLWKLKGVHRLVGRPRVDGTWLGTIQPHPDSRIPADGNRGPIPAALVIEQTYWSMSVALLTAESTSTSLSAVVRADGDSRGRYVLAYTYRNAPGQEHRPRSSPHAGAALLQIAGPTPTALNGTYWTDRLTAGDLRLHRVDRRTDYATLADVPGAAEVAAP